MRGLLHQAGTGFGRISSMAINGLHPDIKRENRVRKTLHYPVWRFLVGDLRGFCIGQSVTFVKLMLSCCLKVSPAHVGTLNYGNCYGMEQTRRSPPEEGNLRERRRRFVNREYRFREKERIADVSRRGAAASVRGRYGGFLVGVHPT